MKKIVHLFKILIQPTTGRCFDQKVEFSDKLTGGKNHLSEKLAEKDRNIMNFCNVK